MLLMGGCPGSAEAGRGGGGLGWTNIPIWHFCHMAGINLRLMAVKEFFREVTK